MAEIYLLTLGLQIVIAPCLYLLGYSMLGHLNLVCVLAYVLALRLHRHLWVALALGVKLSAFLLLLICCALVLGSGSSVVYCLLFAEVELMLSDLRRRTKLLWTAGLTALALSLIGLPSLNASPEGLQEHLLANILLVAVFAMLCAVILRMLTITDRHEYRYRRDAMHDSLTLVLNRRAIFEKASSYWRQQTPFAMILVDADHFKEINDNFGHTAGDAVLHHLAGVLSDALRGEDDVGRVGGEEFLLLLPETGIAEAVTVAERIRVRLARRPCQFSGQLMPVTLSMGIACADEGGHLQSIIELADRRLYAAKSAGRNQVVSEGHVESASSRNAGRLSRGVQDALESEGL
ncbi:GGDEF domain-containing protein [Salinicola sp. DM10]|uniref:GGDEF domain-containing protein n=1 Tax=Salinicola sp. DM10 TaxID=2815721 RepID=UPI001A8C762E|nr:GGDEF domain-containing protein [Salinicola sp. DM10]MCE3026489.1 GGDEF domain-containing protein [Salinicola sp. DM10]